jgi:hypothetical protein
MSPNPRPRAAAWGAGIATALLAAILTSCQTGKPAVQDIPVNTSLLPANAARDGLASVMVIDEGLVVRSVNGQAVDLPRRQRVLLVPGDYRFGFSYQWFLGTRDGVDSWGSQSGMAQRKFNPGDDLLLHMADLGQTREVRLSPLLYKPHVNYALGTNLVTRGAEAKAMAIVPGSAKVAVAGSKGMLEILSAPRTKLVANIKVGSDSIMRLAPGCQDGRVWALDAAGIVWDVDVAAGSASRLLQAVGPVAGLGSSGGALCLVSPEGLVESHDPAGGADLGTSPGLAGAVETLFARQGGWLQYRDDTALWQGPTAVPPRTLKLEAPVLAAGVNGDSSLAVTVLRNGKVLIWRSDRSVPLDLGSYVFNQSSFNPVLAVGFSQDGSHLQLVNYANRIFFWDLSDFIRDTPRFVYNQYAGSDLLVNYQGGSGSRVELLSDLSQGLIAYRLFDKGFSTVVVDNCR